MVVQVGGLRPNLSALSTVVLVTYRFSAYFFHSLARYPPDVPIGACLLAIAGYMSLFRRFAESRVYAVTPMISEPYITPQST